jgi:hypothetical protein
MLQSPAQNLLFYFILFYLFFLILYSAHYILFCTSVGGRNILKDSVFTFTVKPLCSTQKCQIDCSKPVRYQFAEILDAVVSVNESLSDRAVNHEASALSHQICDFAFIVICPSPPH